MTRNEQQEVDDSVEVAVAATIGAIEKLLASDFHEVNAKHARKMFDAFTKEGFSRDEAMNLIYASTKQQK